MIAPRLKDARAGRRTVLFVDAAHFVFGSFLGWVWCVVRFWVKSGSGRQRLSVLGALNATTHNVLTVTSTGSINAESVRDLLRRIARTYGDGPITLFLDNARYQRARIVQDLAAELGIELAFLPPYSPNLNLIERFWKYVKNQCLYSKHYEDFDAFQSAIQDCVRNASRRHFDELDTLLTLNFQSFENAQFLTV